MSTSCAVIVDWTVRSRLAGETARARSWQNELVIGPLSRERESGLYEQRNEEFVEATAKSQSMHSAAQRGASSTGCRWFHETLDVLPGRERIEQYLKR